MRMAPSRLSPREEEVLVLVVAHRMSYREVAAKLGISYHTVVSHVERIWGKLRDIGEESPQKAMARYYRERPGAAA